MGYACPVCDAPQADGEHLANHLAFTAMLHGDEHADFLDDRVGDWEEKTPLELAAELIRHADRTGYDTVFEDTTGRAEPAVDREGGPDEVPDLDALGDESIDAETERVIDEARKLFEQGGGADDED